jgi:hypothetical protein
MYHVSTGLIPDDDDWFLCGLFNDTFGIKTIQLQMTGWPMYDELERILKEAVMTW